MLSSVSRVASVLASWSKTLPALATRLALYRPPAPLTANVNSSELPVAPIQQQIRHFHGLVRQPEAAITTLPQVSQVRTFKMKDRLRKRCKDCYYKTSGLEKMVLCRTHPRHKQKKILPKADYYWIVTHRTQTPRRPW